VSSRRRGIFSEILTRIVADSSSAVRVMRATRPKLGDAVGLVADATLPIDLGKLIRSGRDGLGAGCAHGTSAAYATGARARSNTASRASGPTAVPRWTRDRSIP
jgi:hypothetical protein